MSDHNNNTDMVAGSTLTVVQLQYTTELPTVLGT